MVNERYNTQRKTLSLRVADANTHIVQYVCKKHIVLVHLTKEKFGPRNVIKCSKRHGSSTSCQM